MGRRFAKRQGQKGPGQLQDRQAGRPQRPQAFHSDAIKHYGILSIRVDFYEKGISRQESLADHLHRGGSMFGIPSLLSKCAAADVQRWAICAKCGAFHIGASHVSILRLHLWGRRSPGRPFFYGKDYRHEELVKGLEPNPIKGTNYKRMVAFARTLGFRVDVLTHMSLEDLKRLIDHRKPVIVLIQAWPDSPVQWRDTWDEGHYVVAVGYDERNMYFMDPSTLGHYTFIPIPEFLDRWHDMDDQVKLIRFGMVIRGEGSTIYDPDSIKRLD